jgi:hypothetical protein
MALYARFFAVLATFTAVTASVAQANFRITRGNPTMEDGDAETTDLVAGRLAYTGGGGDTSVSLIIRGSFDGTTWVDLKTVALTGANPAAANINETLDSWPFIAAELVVAGTAPTSIDGTVHFASSAKADLVAA